MSPPSPSGPLALGEIIDRSATFWRQHFKSLFLLSFGFNVGTYIFTKALELPMQRANVTLMAAAQQGDFSTLGAGYARLFLMLGGIFFISLWFYYQNMLVVAAYAVPLQLGSPTSTSEALRRMWKRLGTLTGAYVLSLLWALGITFLLMLPGALLAGGGVLLASSGGGRVLGAILLGVGTILSLLGLLGALLWYLLRFSLLGPVLAMEELSASRAFRRSGELLSGRVAPGFSGRVMVRAMLFVTVVSIILLVVGFLCSLPALILQLSRGSPLDPATVSAPTVSQWLLVPAQLLQVAGQAVFGPLGFVAYALFYLDMRVRREGLDLEQHLEGDARPGVPLPWHECPLVMLWLAALPCDHVSGEREPLTRMTGQAPELLDAYLQEVEARWDGLSLRSPGEDSNARKVETALQRLEAACAGLEEAPSHPGPPALGDPARLQDILSRPEFALARERQGDVVQRLLRLLKDWLETLLETRQALSFATSTRAVVLVLGFGVVLFAALRLRHWRRGPRLTERGTAPGAETALRLDSPGEHLARARTALGAQPREAIRQGLLALLSTLESRRWARPDRVRTNRELVDELPGRGAPERLTQEVERLVRWYDRAFYSLAPVEPQDAARFVAEVERFHQGLEAMPA